MDGHTDRQMDRQQMYRQTDGQDETNKASQTSFAEGITRVQHLY